MKENESLKAKDGQMNILREALTKSNAELKLAKKNIHTTQQKLNFTKKTTEQSLIDNISNPNGIIDDQVLIGVYSATLNEEEIGDKEDDSEETRSRRDIFLKSLEDKIDLKNPDHKERYLQVKNQILEKVKRTRYSRSRSRSSSSITSQAMKRNSDGQISGRSPVRFKSGLPVKSE